jgi:hypothetical protein
LFIHEHIFTFKPLCLHSITKILRNGPRAHFPFKWDRGEMNREWAERVEAAQVAQGEAFFFIYVFFPFLF